MREVRTSAQRLITALLDSGCGQYRTYAFEQLCSGDPLSYIRGGFTYEDVNTYTYYDTPQENYVSVEVLKDFVYTFNLVGKTFKDVEEFNDTLEVFFKLSKYVRVRESNTVASMIDACGIFIKKDKIPFVLYRLCTGKSIPIECYTFITEQEYLQRALHQSIDNMILFTVASTLGINTEIVVSVEQTTRTDHTFYVKPVQLDLGSCRTPQEASDIAVGSVQIFNDYIEGYNITNVPKGSPESSCAEEVEDYYKSVIATVPEDLEIYVI